MTALCGGGTSSGRSSFGASVSVGVAQLAALLNNVPTPVAFALAGYLGLVAYDLSVFCVTDPPAMPTITAGDWVAALTLSDPVSHAQAIAKFQDMFANLLWPTFCKCDVGSTPAPPSLPSPPANLPTVNPTALPTGPSASPCWDSHQAYSIAPGTSVQRLGAITPESGTPITVTIGGSNFSAYPIPAGANSAAYTATFSWTGVLSFAQQASLTFYTSAGGVISNVLLGSTGNGNGVSFHTTFSIPSTAAFWIATCANNGANPALGLDLELTFFCAGSSSTALSTPCCPPDPSETALLQTILQLVTSIYQGLPTDLNSFAEATVHSGLSGNGTVPIGAQTIAVKVSITTDIAGAPIDTGSPDYYFSRGYIVPITLEAPIAATRKLVYNPQVFMLPKLTEEVGYSLPVGLVISITELTPGP